MMIIKIVKKYKYTRMIETFDIIINYNAIMIYEDSKIIILSLIRVCLAVSTSILGDWKNLLDSHSSVFERL